MAKLDALIISLLITNKGIDMLQKISEKLYACLDWGSDYIDFFKQGEDPYAPMPVICHSSHNEGFVQLTDISEEDLKIIRDYLEKENKEEDDDF